MVRVRVSGDFYLASVPWSLHSLACRVQQPSITYRSNLIRFRTGFVRHSWLGLVMITLGVG